MGNTTSDPKMSNPIEYFQSTMLNNITIFTTMTIIYLFISADKLASYTSMDQFMFMNLITNPHPCDKKPKKKPAAEAKNANAKANGAGLGSAISGALGAVGGPAGLAAAFSGKGGPPGLAGLAGLAGKGGPPGLAGTPPPGNAGAAPPAANKVGGGTVSENLTTVASTLNNVGKAINSFTADVKHDVDYESYKIETLSKHKETYCNDMDDMGAFGAFFFILHSSFLACYNSIQMVNAGIVRLIYSNSVWGPFDLGILALYLLFFIMSTASTSFIEYITKLIDPSVSSSNAFLRQLILSIFSALISLFFVYFIVAIISYITYLSYGMLNIKSEQSSTTFKVIYAILFFINVMITIPSVFGVKLF